MSLQAERNLNTTGSTGENNPVKVTQLGHVGMGTGQVSPFNQVFTKGLHVTPKDIKDGAPIDALVIWGGEDISPSLYNDTVSIYTGASERLSYRDQIESAAVYEAIRRDIPVIGICRGAQLVCALSGGRLIQHVTNHTISHPMRTVDGRTVETSSMHHQMMYPYDLPEEAYELLAWCAPKRSTMYVVSDDNHEEKGMEEHPECEVVWFPKSKCLAIQGHPEFHRHPETDVFVQYCMELTRKYVLRTE